MTIKTFKEMLTEGAASNKDLFKRDDRKTFIDKAQKGELVDTKGNKIPKVSSSSEIIKYMKDNDSPSPEMNKAFLDSYGKSFTALKIDKQLNGFSPSSGRGAGSEPSGAEWEEVICIAYNMAKGMTKDKAMSSAGISNLKEKLEGFIPVGSEIVKNAFGNPKGTMEHYGAGTANLNKQWDKWFVQTTGKPAQASTKTPKTDMYIGAQHISLKKHGGSQLMSGGKAETLATLAFAYENLSPETKTKALDRAWSKLTKQIEKDFTKINLPSGETIGGLKKKAETGTKDKLVKLVKESLTKQSEMTNAIRDILSTPEAKIEVCREAMTGRSKFSEKLPIATHMMIFGADGRGAYKPINDKLVNFYAARTKFNISFKSSGAGGQSWTALKGIFNEQVETPLLDEIINEAYKVCSEELLQEGILSNVGNALKKGVNAVKMLLVKMLKFIWNKVKTLLASSLEYVQSILGIKMTANNPTVVW